MIQASELRIGNYVNVIRPRHDEKYLVIESITGTDVNIDFRDYNLEQIEPIELTDEILKKVWFVNGEWKDKTSANCLFVNDGKIYISDARDTNYSFVAECKYVHQLQNLYYLLVGSELEFVW